MIIMTKIIYLLPHMVTFVCVCARAHERASEKERTFKIYSPRKLQVYTKVLLTIVTMLYIRSPEFVYAT